MSRGLKIKFYVKSRVIRSVGDAPNGVLGIHNFDGNSRFVINSKVEPKAHSGKPQVEFQRFAGDGEDAGVHVTAEEVVEAAADMATARAIYESAAANVQRKAALALPRHDLEALEATVKLAREVRDQLAVCGYIRKVDRGE